MADPAQSLPMPQHLRDMFNAAFAFRKKYQRPENTETFWTALADEMCAISAKFGNDPFIRDLLASCCYDVEREMQRGTADDSNKSD